jgi:hypothetical protein
MEKISLDQIPVTGLPLYEMQQLFRAAGNYSEVKISYITSPRNRVPVWDGCIHETNNRSFWSRVYTETAVFREFAARGMPH